MAWLIRALATGYLDAESEGGIEQDLRGRRYPGGLYAAADDEDYDSEDL